jgi:hypothetical protein
MRFKITPKHHKGYMRFLWFPRYCRKCGIGVWLEKVRVMGLNWYCPECGYEYIGTNKTRIQELYADSLAGRESSDFPPIVLPWEKSSK